MLLQRQPQRVWHQPLHAAAPDTSRPLRAHRLRSPPRPPRALYACARAARAGRMPGPRRARHRNAPLGFRLPGFGGGGVECKHTRVAGQRQYDGTNFVCRSSNHYTFANVWRQGPQILEKPSQSRFRPSSARACKHSVIALSPWLQCSQRGAASAGATLATKRNEPRLGLASSVSELGATHPSAE